MEIKQDLIKVFEHRYYVALAKVKSNYRKEHSEGVSDAYREVLKDLGVSVDRTEETEISA